VAEVVGAGAFISLGSADATVDDVAARGTTARLFIETLYFPTSDSKEGQAFDSS
jgi:hypothetical protein